MVLVTSTDHLGRKAWVVLGEDQLGVLDVLIGEGDFQSIKVSLDVLDFPAGGSEIP
jgi:hypothetical protein